MMPMHAALVIVGHAMATCGLIACFDCHSQAHMHECILHSCVVNMCCLRCTCLSTQEYRQLQNRKCWFCSSRAVEC